MSAADIQFDASTHKYWHDGQRVISVTQALEATGLFFYPETMEMLEARGRGTIVHDATELFDKGTLDWNSLDDVIEPYVLQYEEAKHDLKFTVKEWEVKVYHKTLDYAGRFDKLATYQRKKVIIDLKTGTQIRQDKWHHLQVAAYRETFTGKKPDAYILYLSPRSYRWVKMDENAPMVWKKLMAGIKAAKTYCS